MAWVKGSTWVPIFDVDENLDAGTLSRKITGFMMGNGTFFVQKLEEGANKVGT
ncbi:hypothetical protein ACS0TY_013106 [Phlomoides rotata]